MKNITWDNIICTFASTGCNSTKDRKLREFSNKRWQKLRFTPLDQTSGSDFLQLLYNGGTATSVYLKAVQAIAIETGLITHPVLPKKIWPKHTQNPKEPSPRKSIEGCVLTLADTLNQLVLSFHLIIRFLHQCSLFTSKARLDNERSKWKNRCNKTFSYPP